MVLITDLKKTAFPKKQLKKAFNAKKKKKKLRRVILG